MSSASDYLETGSSSSVSKYYNAQGIGLLGLFVWEIVVTIPFEWSFVRRLRTPRWSLVLYTGTRISLLLYLLTLVINVFDHDTIRCNPQQWMMNVTTSLVIWLCGAMLSLRVLAISSRTDRTTGIVGMFLAGLLVTNCLTWRSPDKVWNSTLSRCVTQELDKAFIIAQYVYALAFHLALVAMFIVKSKPRKTLPEVKRLVIQDGLGIFLIVTVVYLVQAVIICIWLDDLVNIVFLPLALTIVTIAVTRSYVYGVRKAEASREFARRTIPTTRPLTTTRPPPSSWRKSSATTIKNKLPL